MSIPVLPAFPSAAESIPAGAAKTDVGTDGSVFESLVAESVAENTPPSANKDASPKDGASAPAADTQKAPEEKQTNAQTWLGIPPELSALLTNMPPAQDPVADVADLGAPAPSGIAASGSDTPANAIPPELPSEAVAADPSGAKPAGQQNAGVLAEPVTAPMPNIAHAQPSAGEPVQQGNAVSSNGAPALAVNAQNTRRPQGSSEQTDVKHAGAPNTLTDEPHAAPATVSAPSHEQSEAALLAAAKAGTPIATASTAFTEPQEAAAAAALLKPAPQRSAAPANSEQASAANELAKSVAGPLEAPGPAGAAEDKRVLQTAIPSDKTGAKPADPANPAAQPAPAARAADVQTAANAAAQPPSLRSDATPAPAPAQSGPALPTLTLVQEIGFSNAAALQSAAVTSAPVRLTALAGGASDMEALAARIAHRAVAGDSRFEIRLDPPELGRIDIRLDVQRNGQVQAQLTADRPQTLDLLQRDSASLERALKDAGLDLGSNLSFSLKGEGRHAQQQAEAPQYGRLTDELNSVAPAAAAGATQRFFSADRRVDITV